MAKKATKAASKKSPAKKPAKKTGVKDQQESSDRLQRLKELLSKKEELLPELKPYRKHHGTDLDGFYHPLFHCPLFSEGHYAYVNHLYRIIQERLEEYRRKKDFYRAVFCYRTPHLLDGFVEEVAEPDDKTYWTILGAVWVHTESPWVNRKLFLQLFNSPRPHREFLMDADERKALKKLPAQLTIYRGFAGERGKGLSWTLDRDKAVWFAKRFHVLHGQTARVIEGTCQNSDVFAHFTGRGESEIVIDPEKVKRQKKVPLEG